jgi:uncharacterized protein YlxW (UPF0749 family)
LTTDKLRSQLHSVERERRDLQRRYREQSASFDAERQSWNDAERHLQSRISSLSKTALNARRQTVITAASEPKSPIEHDAEADEEADNLAPLSVVRAKSPSTSSRRSLSPTPPVDATELAQEIKELQEQYEALLTSYDSLNKSHEVLQDETGDLKRINRELMDQQESYEMLLGERTVRFILSSLICPF